MANTNVVICKLCEKIFKTITFSHLYRKHKMSFSEYILRFPDASLVSDESRENSSKIGKKNKGRRAWNKGLTATEESRQKTRDTHWSRKPIEETIDIRAKMSINGTNTMKRINDEGKAFRMPKGYHTEEHKEKMRQLMLGRTVTWNDKIKDNHWTKKSVDEVQDIVDRIQQSGTNRNTKHGWYYSKKMKEDFFYMSSYEEIRMKFLDNHLNVISFTNKHKIWIDYEWEGNIHRYNPDLLVTFSDGTKRIEEIKGAILDENRNKIKESVCIDYANENGFYYKMIFKNDLEKI